MADQRFSSTGMTREGGSALGGEATLVVGAAAAVLSILGLAGLLPSILAEVAVILVGAAFLAGTGGASGRAGGLLTQDEREQLRALPIGGAVTTEFVGGLAAAVLGLLALLGVASATLVAVSVIMLGAVAILSSRTRERMAALAIEASAASAHVKALAREASAGSMGAGLLVGMGAITLGILALVTFPATSLVLVATLALGVAVLLGTGARGARAS